jgi:hypothetical protein
MSLRVGCNSTQSPAGSATPGGGQKSTRIPNENKNQLAHFNRLRIGQGDANPGNAVNRLTAKYA